MGICSDKYTAIFVFCFNENLPLAVCLHGGGADRNVDYLSRFGLSKSSRDLFYVT